MSKRWIVVGLVTVIVVAGTAVWLSRAATPKPKPLGFAVDASLRPSVPDVGPVTDATAASRAVGVLTGPDGNPAELVLDELIVHVTEPAQLAAFLDRWGGTLVDSFPADADGQDHLVRVDVSRADPARLAADLNAAEPTRNGEHRVSDERVTRLLAIAAAEWRTGTEVVVNWLSEPAAITDGTARESKDIDKNVFQWSYMRTGGDLDIGVGAAWQLLQTRGKLKPQVEYLVMDGGFSPNFDFPEQLTIRKGEWGKTNAKSCTGGAPCPYHGTDVVLAGMGKVDNGYGTAGPAGPVVAKLVAVGNSIDYWTDLRRLEAVAEDEHPDVVNLSFGRSVNLGSAHAKKWTDRRMRHVRDTGALIVAAAGNEGRSVDTDTLWVPCESTYVLCVGGFDGSGSLDDDSNYGESGSTTSVELYGPMCVRSINDPNRSALDFTTRNVCGTSVASPFVAGVAALVMAANPNLGPEEVRAILKETAHAGRRINALHAVAKALGVNVAPPNVTIAAPTNGAKLGVAQWVDLRGTATDFMGRDAPLDWSSDRDGKLVRGSKTSIQPLSAGTHKLTATATDSTGRTASATVSVTVVDTPPDLSISSPHAGLKVLEGTNVPLVATSVDKDTWTPVADGEVKWEVRRGGTLVHSATGHQAMLPAAKATPGSYTATLSTGSVSEQGSFTVMAVPAGQTKPVATIALPSGTKTVSAYNGKPQDISFAGSGTDKEDGAIAGTRYRWVARSAHETKVLCVGSNVPHGGSPGGIVVPKNCTRFTGQLGLSSGDIATTAWTVWLEVYDATGLVGLDSVTVKIQYVTG
jgi:serine protease